MTVVNSWSASSGAVVSAAALSRSSRDQWPMNSAMVSSGPGPAASGGAGEVQPAAIRRVASSPASS